MRCFFLILTFIFLIMKTVKLFLAAFLMAMVCSNVLAGAPVTKSETLKVQGNCGMCKSRIEKAVKVDGVSKAEWNADTKILAVTYDPAKTNLDEIGKKVAAVGHDNEKAKADDKTYKSLPMCCKYR